MSHRFSIATWYPGLPVLAHPSLHHNGFAVLVPVAHCAAQDAPALGGCGSFVVLGVGKSYNVDPRGSISSERIAKSCLVVGFNSEKYKSQLG